MATAPNEPWMENPIFAGRDLTRLSTSYEQPEQPRKPRPAPPAIGRIIGELGLRYRPSAQADLEAHAEALRLLVMDLADVPAHLLETAAKRWVRENRFMPKASELVALARGEVTEQTKGTDHGLAQLQAHCDRLNAINQGQDGWHVFGEPGKRSIRMRREAPKSQDMGRGA